jgi:hypothetical protein
MCKRSSSPRVFAMIIASRVSCAGSAAMLVAAVLFTAQPASVARAQSQSDSAASMTARISGLTPDFEAYIRNGMKAYDVPGLAIVGIPPRVAHVPDMWEPVFRQGHARVGAGQVINTSTTHVATRAGRRSPPSEQPFNVGELQFDISRAAVIALSGIGGCLHFA